MKTNKSVCVFCGASNNVPKEFLEIGSAFGKILAEKGVRLVYGGGDCGVMGAIANGVMTNGGEVTGVFPVSLRNIENEHQGLSEIIVVNTMHERKQLMFERSDAFIVFPGGFGTMDEMFEIITWKQLKLHHRPIVIYNYQKYWDPLIALMKNIIDVGFAKPEVAGYYTVVDHVEAILEVLNIQPED
ncbi:MAG: TIGR00730 family Rossman fold protein [Rickettsiales bacterium]|nr:TIGR00730 family Rossman fold protein [Rickettsiales bacterium]